MAQRKEHGAGRKARLKEHGAGRKAQRKEHSAPIGAKSALGVGSETLRHCVA